MTVATGRRSRLPVYWGLVPASLAFSVPLLMLSGPVPFRAGVAGVAVIAATVIAVGDSRTGKLRNAWTGPFAAAGGLHALSASILITHGSGLIATTLIALGVNAGLYVAIGLGGWVGFGDVKFMVGLTLFAALLVGRVSLLLPLVALLAAGIVRVCPAGSQFPASARPHGPALVIAFVLILVGAWVS